MHVRNIQIRIAVTAIFLVAAIVLAWFQFRSPDRERSSLVKLGGVPPFHLITDENKEFSDRDLRGHVTIVDFIFTNCAGPCPLMSGQVEQMQTATLENPDIRFLSFSVDPETDTPDVLRSYGDRFGARSGKWTFLTGDKMKIYDLIRNGFHLAIEADSDAIAHSTKFVLLDKEASIRGYYDSGDDSVSAELIHDARGLTRE